MTQAYDKVGMVVQGGLREMCSVVDQGIHIKEATRNLLAAILLSPPIFKQFRSFFSDSCSGLLGWIVVPLSLGKE